MIDRTRDNDNDLIEQLTDIPTPGQSGASGGDLAREIGQRDELQSADGEDPTITRVHKRDKPGDGDEPTLPNRQD